MSIKPPLPDDELAGIARSWAGRTVQLEPLAEGEDSRAVAFTAGSERYVLRVRREGTGFLKEPDVRALLAPVGVEVPEVVGIGESGGYSWCVSRRAPGSTLQELDPAAAAAVGPALVETWRAISSVDGSDTGQRPASFRHAPAASWADHLRELRAEVAAARPDLLEMVGAGRLDAAADVIADEAVGAADAARLVHFDFGANNVLTDGVRITAVLDWDYPGWGDPSTPPSFAPSPEDSVSFSLVRRQGRLRRG